MGSGFFEKLFKDSFMNGPFGADPFMNHFFGDQVREEMSRATPHIRPNARQRRGPIIEEFKEDEDAPTSSASPSRVQEPDDEDSSGREEAPTESSRSNVFNSFRGSQSASRRTGSSFMSSFAGGSSMPGTTVYYSSTTTRIGPNGVSETKSTVRDSRTGVEKVVIERSLGDRTRTVMRQRDAAGREERIDTLRNLQQDDLLSFDEQWREAAESQLRPFGLGLGTRRLPSAVDSSHFLNSGPMSSPSRGSSSLYPQSRRTVSDSTARLSSGNVTSRPLATAATSTVRRSGVGASQTRGGLSTSSVHRMSAANAGAAHTYSPYERSQQPPQQSQQSNPTYVTGSSSRAREHRRY